MHLQEIFGETFCLRDGEELSFRDRVVARCCELAALSTCDPQLRPDSGLDGGDLDEDRSFSPSEEKFPLDMVFPKAACWAVEAVNACLGTGGGLVEGPDLELVSSFSSLTVIPGQSFSQLWMGLWSVTSSWAAGSYQLVIGLKPS